MFIITKSTIINMAHVSVVKDDNYPSPMPQYHTTTFTFHDGTELSLQGPAAQLVAALHGRCATLVWDDGGGR